MTEPVDLDALASAYIDDELDAAERVAAEAEPSVMAKVAEFRRIADLVRSPIAVDASSRDRSIAAALEQLEVNSSIAEAADDSVKVSTLRPRRSRRAWNANPALVWGPIGLVAAAIVAVAVLSVGSNDDGVQTSAITTFAADVSSAKAGGAAESSTAQAASNGGGADEGRSDAATSATRAAASATTAAGAATTVASSVGDASTQLTTIGSATGVPDLGVVSTASELGQRLTGRALAGAGTATTTAPPSTTNPPTTLAAPTAAPSIGCPQLGTAVATAVLNGTPVVVHADGRGGYVIIDPSCEQVSRLDAGGAVTP